MKELEDKLYLYREQLRENGRFSKKIWIFSDEGLTVDDIFELCPECSLSGFGKVDKGKPTTTNTHSTNKKEINKKNTQKKGRKRTFYEFVNKLKKSAKKYPNLRIEFENRFYCFVEKNGQLLLKDESTDVVFSKIEAQNIYQKMSSGYKLKILRNLK